MARSASDTSIARRAKATAFIEGNAVPPGLSSSATIWRPGSGLLISLRGPGICGSSIVPKPRRRGSANSVDLPPPEQPGIVTKFSIETTGPLPNRRGGCKWEVHDRLKRLDCQCHIQRTELPRSDDPNAPSTHPNMSRDLRIRLPIERSEANSDVVRVFGYAREHGRPATRTKTPPSARRRLILRYQIATSNDPIPFEWNSRIGRKGCAVGTSTMVAVTKTNLTYWSQNLEPEAATEAFAADRLRCHEVRACQSFLVAPRFQ